MDCWLCISSSLPRLCTFPRMTLLLRGSICEALKERHKNANLVQQVREPREENTGVAALKHQNVPIKKQLHVCGGAQVRSL